MYRNSEKLKTISQGDHCIRSLEIPETHKKKKTTNHTQKGDGIGALFQNL